MKRIAVALSGGVDSAVVAYLVKRDPNNEVVGFTMKLYDTENPHPGTGCFCASQKDEIESAKRVAAQLGIEHHVVDCSKIHAEKVMKYFHDEYMAGKTPNPCVRCNAELKFNLFPKLIEEQFGHFDQFVTGHYANVVYHCTDDIGSDTWELSSAKCLEKDQSYFLAQVPKKLLSRFFFPLGTIKSKNEVRKIAEEIGLDVADKKDSMDFYSGNKAELVEAEASEIVHGERIGGSVVDCRGNEIGAHGGYWKYTVGQRHGFSCNSAVPMYILKIVPDKNQLVVGPIEEARRDHFKIKDINWLIDYSDEASTGKCNIKIRSNGKTHRGYVVNYDVDMMLDDNVILDEPVFGVTPGQLAVVYTDDNKVVCSGYIC